MVWPVPPIPFIHEGIRSEAKEAYSEKVDHDCSRSLGVQYVHLGDGRRLSESGGDQGP